MPNPGKAPLKRLNLVKGPVYLHSSLRKDVSAHNLFMFIALGVGPHIRRHGSFEVEPEEAASLRMSKPDKFGRDEGAMTLRRQVSRDLKSRIRFVNNTSKVQWRGNAFCAQLPPSHAVECEVGVERKSSESAGIDISQVVSPNASESHNKTRSSFDMN